MEEEYEEPEGFRLNMDILEEQTSVVTTLGDRYGYNVFSEAFAENMERYKEEQEQDREESIRRVFGQERNDETERVFEAVFSAEAQTIVKAEQKEEYGESTNDGFIIGFVFTGMFLTGIFLFAVQKLRKGRQRYAVDSYNDWAKYENV